MNRFIQIIILWFVSFICFSQQVEKKFQVNVLKSNNSILEISNESLLKLKNLGFDYTSNSELLSRNFAENFDFNKDGFNDIVWVVSKNPSIGSPVLLFLWDVAKGKYVEDSRYFILGHGDHMLYYDTVYDFDQDGDLDVYLPIENYHGKPGNQPTYYLPDGKFMPGNLLINESNAFNRIYIDTTIVDMGKKDYPAYWQASLINFNQDDTKDLLVPTINQRPDSQGFLAAWYTIDKNKKINRQFVFPWISKEMYRGQTHSMIFRNFKNRIYAFLQPKEDYPDGINTFYFYTYPEIWIYDKTTDGNNPDLIEKIELKRNLKLLNQGSIIYNDGFYISDLDKDGKEEYILGMFSLPISSEHWAIHIFDNKGNEITDKWFDLKEYLESTGASANGYDLIDLNKDGYDDILPRDRFNCSDKQISFFLNNGKKFEKHVLETNGENGFNLPVDMNNDGLKEILKVNNKAIDPSKIVTMYSLNYLLSNDLDGDGILNSLDKCPNTPLGTKVNENGCEIVLSEQEESVHVNAIPNPFETYFKINFPAEFGKTVQVKVVDMLGNVQFKKVSVINGEQINLNDLTGGNYILQLNSNDNTNGKVIKIKKLNN